MLTNTTDEHKYQLIVKISAQLIYSEKAKTSIQGHILNTSEALTRSNG